MNFCNWIYLSLFHSFFLAFTFAVVCLLHFLFLFFVGVHQRITFLELINYDFDIFTKRGDGFFFIFSLIIFRSYFTKFSIRCLTFFFKIGSMNFYLVLFCCGENGRRLKHDMRNAFRLS